ncbi:hypothetical protein AL073_06200 [Loktanella sp. 1ANDIMAR09]|nr:hypothetical protein AL073_06200 [Loktanella sp. 1ANDIMAR09]
MMNVKILSAVAIIATASTASAGGLFDEIVEQDVQAPVVVAEPAGSGSIWIPLAILAVLIAVAAGDSGGGS